MSVRRILLFGLSLGICVFAALAAQPNLETNQPPRILTWARQSSLETPATAILVELGKRDGRPTDWSGTARLQGARVVRREGYCFRPDAGDRLIEPHGWTASSHRALKAPRNNPVLNRLLGMSAVGVVFHLEAIHDDATLTVQAGTDQPTVTVTLRKVLSGQPQPIYDGLGVVRLVSTALPLVTQSTEDDFPAACYTPDGSLWVAWQAYRLRDEQRRIRQPRLDRIPEDFSFLHKPGYSDQLLIKCFRNGRWTQPMAVTNAQQDLLGCALTAAGNQTVMVHYVARTAQGMQLFQAECSPEGLTKQPTLVSNVKRSGIRPVACNRDAQTAEVAVAPGTGSRFTVAVASGPDGQTNSLCDVYRDGDYDILLDETEPIATSSKFEARPACCYDTQGRLWIAYEEGPVLWGKDYGALDNDDGQPLYTARSIKVVCVQDGKLLRPVAELPVSKVKPPEFPAGRNPGPAFELNTDRYAYPQIGIDGKGRIWITYRRKFGTRHSTELGSYWLSFAHRLEGDHWSAPIELHHSDGLLDCRPVLLPHKSGGVLIVHTTDGRYSTPRQIDNNLYLSYLDLSGDPVEPTLVPHAPGEKDPALLDRAQQEAAAVERIRAYRINHNGQNLRLLRGEYHRHTEISWDGGPDGSLEDMFRYAMDAAAMDWIGNGDHDNGGGREYTWWLTQKFSDAYHVPGQFTPMFTYERSVRYPHGHRNVMFAKRGIQTLPRLGQPDPNKRVAGIHADDTKMLYKYLHQFDGICAVHTSATSMGTDWRDNDSQVEPIVEIYQGDRMSYEQEGAPRAGYPAKANRFPVNIAGWYPKGFIDNALLNKGYKLGFQSSSDHWSTHLSYFIVLAPENSRTALLEAIKQRHCYGATDDIICDVRCHGHLMGDVFTLRNPPTLSITVEGTGELAHVEIIKDSQLTATLNADGPRLQTKWTDPKPSQGEHFYYVRIRQKNGEIAWTSPMWIRYQK